MAWGTTAAGSQVWRTRAGRIIVDAKNRMLGGIGFQDQNEPRHYVL